MRTLFVHLCSVLLISSAVFANDPATSSSITQTCSSAHESPTFTVAGAGLEQPFPNPFAQTSNGEASVEDLTLASIGLPQVGEWYRSALQFVAQTGHDPSKPFVTLVVPAYKESKRIGNSIQIIRTFFEAYPFPVEVHFRIELSPDNTAELTHELVGKDPLFKVFAHEVQKGKGYAVRQGMLEAESPFVFFMDADLSTPLFHVFEFLSAFRERPDIQVLVGDRKREGASVVEAQPWYRRAMSRTFGLLTQACMGGALSGAKDTQCGFKAFRADAAQAIFSNATENGFAFDLEIFVLAQELGIQLHPMPVQWKNDERSTVHPIWDSLKMLKTMILVRREVQERLRNSGGMPGDRRFPRIQ